MPPTSSAAAFDRDRDVVECIAAGDAEGAFEMLLPRYENKVFRLCLALLRERAAAQDAAQESLLRVWKSLRSYDGRAALSTWIYAITRNRCLTALQRREELLSLDDETVGAEAEAAAAHDPVPGAERSAALRQLVDALPEAQRRVITLYYFEERAVGEVAAMLGCPEGTVKTHLFRARAALAARLQALGLHDAALWAA